MSFKKFIITIIILLCVNKTLYSQCTPVISSNPLTTSGCEVFTIQFSDVSGCIIQQRLWDFGDGTTSSVQNPSQSFNAGVIGDTSYTVELRLQDIAGVWHTTSKLVNVYKKPNISFSTDKSTVCAIVDSVYFSNLSVMPVGSTVVWDFGDGSPTSISNNPVHKYNTPGVYTAKLTITNAKNCSQFVTKNITVNEIPNPNFSQSGVVGCNPMPVDFTNTTIEGVFPITNWLWDFGGINTSGLEEPGQEIFNDAGVYTISLSATNTAGCTNKTVTNVIVKKTPTADFVLPAAVCFDDTALVTYIGDGAISATYDWDFSSPKSIEGSDQGPIKVIWNSSGIKQVKLKVTELGCEGNFSANISVNDLPEVTLTTDDLNDSICEYHPITFIALPDTFDSYNFYNLGSSIQNSSSNLYNEENLSFPNSITVVATDSNGCKSIASVAKVIEVLPKPIITISSSEDTICNGDNIVFNASGAFDEYTFMKGFLSLQTGVSNIYSTDSIDDGDLITAFATENGCAGDPSNSIKIKVEEPLSTPNLNCGNSTNTTVSFVWDDNESVSEYEIKIDAGVYNSTTTRLREEITGLNFGDTIWARVFGHGDLPCGNTLISDSVFCIAKPCDSVSFAVAIPSSICALDTVDVLVSGIKSPSLNFGISWQNSLFSRDSMFQFVASVSEVINVELIDSSQLGCPTFKQQIDVKVNELPVIDLSSEKENLCEGVSYDFTGSLAGYDSYQFYVNDTLRQDSSLHVFTYNNFYPGLTQVVMKTIEKGCISNDTVNVDVIEKSDITLSVDQDSICDGDIVNYSATLGFDHYKFRDFPSNELSFDSTLNKYSSSVYNKVIVVGVDEFGCISYPDSEVVYIKKLPIIQLNSSAFSDSICEGEVITFSVTPATSTSYEFWDNYSLIQDSTVASLINSDVLNNHFYAARAILDGCFGPFSDSIVFKVREKMEPSVVNCGLTGDGKMEFTWDSVATSEGYLVSVNNGGYLTPLTGNFGLSHTISGLAPLDTVCLNVITKGPLPCGNSIPSAPICCVMPCAPVSFDQNFTTLTVCSGDSVTMNIFNISSPTGIYQIGWNGDPFDNLSKKVILPLSDTVLSISVWDSTQGGCTPTTKYFTIKVNEKPKVTLIGDTSFCSNDYISLQASPTNYDNYQFYDRLLPISSGLTPVQIDSIVRDGHYYTVVATHKGCVDTSNVLNIHVEKKLEVPDVFCGITTQSSVEIMWDSVLNATDYEISVNGYPYVAPSSGSSGVLHYTNGMSAGDSITAVVRAKGDAPCIYSQASESITCVAQICSLVNFKKGNDLEICTGDLVNFSLSQIVSPTNQYGITWDGGLTFSKQLSFSANIYTDSIITVGIIDSTQLSCPLVSKTIDVVINTIPNFNLISNASNDSICQGEDLVIKSDVIGFDSYQFFIDNVQVQDSILYQYSTNSLSIGNHQIKVNSNNLGCYYLADSIEFSVVSFPSLILNSSDVNDTICAGSEVSFTANPGFETYSFYFRGVEAQSGSDLNFVVSTMEDGDEVFCVASNKNLCYRTSDTISTKVWDIPDFNLSSSDIDNNICSKDTVEFTLSPTPDYYVIYNDNDSIGKYNNSSFLIDTLENGDKIYVLGSLNGCVDYSDTIETVVEFTPTAVANFDTLSICVGDPATVLASGGGTYLWQDNSTGSSITVYPSVTTYFWVKVATGNCTSKADSVFVYVDGQIPIADAGQDEEICRYDSVQLFANGGASYKWFVSNNISNDSVFNPIVKPIESFVYWLEVTNVVCKDTALVTVNVDKCLSELPSEIPQIITPNNDGNNDYLVIDDIDYFDQSEITIYNRWSSVVYKNAPYNNEWNGLSNRGNELPDGTYFVVLDLGNGSKIYTGYVMIQR